MSTLFKFFILLVIFGNACDASKLRHLVLKTLEEKPEIVERFTNVLARRLVRKISLEKFDYSIKNLDCNGTCNGGLDPGLIPPPGFNFTSDERLVDLFEFPKIDAIYTGHMRFCDVLISGLKNVGHRLNIPELGLSGLPLYLDSIPQLAIPLVYELQAGPLTFKGDHAIDANLLNRIRIQSQGVFEFDVNLKIILTVFGSFNRDFKLMVKNADLNIQLPTFSIKNNGFTIITIDGKTELLDWVKASPEIKKAFEDIWPLAQFILNPILSSVLSAIVGGCGVDALPLGSLLPYSLLNDDSFPGCINDFGLGLFPDEELMIQQIEDMITQGIANMDAGTGTNICTGTNGISFLKEQAPLPPTPNVETPLESAQVKPLLKMDTAGS